MTTQPTQPSDGPPSSEAPPSEAAPPAAPPIEAPAVDWPDRSHFSEFDAAIEAQRVPAADEATPEGARD